MSGDSPSPEWYEAPDLVEDDEDVPPDAAETLVIANGIVWWTAAA